jgi:hypothetical protein
MEAADLDSTHEDEWLIIDPEFRDRFWHSGGTRLPGQGASWKHL